MSKPMSRSELESEMTLLRGKVTMLESIVSRVYTLVSIHEYNRSSSGFAYVPSPNVYLKVGGNASVRTISCNAAIPTPISTLFEHNMLLSQALP